MRSDLGADFRWGLSQILAVTIVGVVLAGGLSLLAGPRAFGELRDFAVRFGLGYAAGVVMVGLIIGAARPHLHRKGPAVLVGIASAWVSLLAVGVQAVAPKGLEAMVIVLVAATILAPVIGSLTALGLHHAFTESRDEEE